MVVSRLRPPSTAQTLQPPPRCAKTARPFRIPASWLATMRSAEAKASPWKP